MILNYLLAFFREIFGSSLFSDIIYPCVGIGIVACFFRMLYSFIDKRCV